MILLLHRHNKHGIGNINLEIDDDNENYININYIDKNNEDIEKNKNNISSNLGKINNNENNISSNLGKINNNENNVSTNLRKIDTNEGNISSNLGKMNTNKGNISSNLIKINSNEDDILYNLNEINYIKNNKSTQYLKNIYNVLIYDSKNQIGFRKDLFFEKIFDVNSNKNDFLEIFFKIELEYQDTDDRHYVKMICELFDENDNRLYIKSVTNNEYIYFSNKLIVDENFFIILLRILKK